MITESRSATICLVMEYNDQYEAIMNTDRVKTHMRFVLSDMCVAFP